MLLLLKLEFYLNYNYINNCCEVEYAPPVNKVSLDIAHLPTYGRTNSLTEDVFRNSRRSYF